MADKPMNINKIARDIAAQRPGEPLLEGSFEIGSVSVVADERLDVAGVAYVFAYGGGAVSAHDGYTG